MYLENKEGLLHTHGQAFADAQFADLDDREWTDVSPSVDFLLNAGTFLLMLSPVLIVIGFKVL